MSRFISMSEFQINRRVAFPPFILIFRSCVSQTLKMHDSRNSKRKKKVLQQAKKNKMAELQCNRSSSCISFRKFPSPQPPQTPPLFDFLEGFVVVAPGLPTETTSFLLLLSIAQINMWLYRLSVYLYTPTGRRG